MAAFVAIVRSRSVHPRTRGEHQLFWQRPPMHLGSSPHSRGTSSKVAFTSSAGRFIPALAGNIDRHGRRRCESPVHPRTRGEHASSSRLRVFARGSSPHPRGTLLLLVRRSVAVRFIPAPAGNIHIPPVRCWKCPVHPRTRGEHNVLVLIGSRQAGSSPHPRGTLPGQTTVVRKHRFIPAPAGNIWRNLIIWHKGAVHPRTRGEHPASMLRMPSTCGSSPHPRGTLSLIM